MLGISLVTRCLALLVYVAAFVTVGSGDTNAYEEAFIGHRLVVNYHTVWDSGKMVLSEDECHKLCLNTTHMNCAGFSYCGNASCLVTSTYLKMGSKETTDEIEIAPECSVYRRRAMDFFKQFPGQVPLSRGDQEEQADTPQDCATKCRNYEDFYCQGFQSCGNRCFLHRKHVLDADATTDKPQLECPFYFLDYASSFVSGSNVIVKDPNARSWSNVTYNECAEICFTQPELRCRSINYCAAHGFDVSKCQINTVEWDDPRVETVLSETCQHYIMFGGSNKPTPTPGDSSLFQNLKYSKTYETHSQVTFSSQGISSITVYVDEYHDLEQKIGRLDMKHPEKGKMQHYYYTSEDSVATVRDYKCNVRRIDNFVTDDRFGILYHRASGLIGPSALFSNTGPLLENGQTVIRGIPCSKWTNVDSSSGFKTDMYFSVPGWNTTGKQFEAPLRIDMAYNTTKGKPQRMIIDFAFFVVNQSFAHRDTFLIPTGIGCQSLSRKEADGAEELQSKLLSEIMSYFVTATNLNYYITSPGEVGSSLYSFRAVLDSKNLIMQVEGVDSQTYQYGITTYDFSAGVEYTIKKDGSCKMSPIFSKTVEAMYSHDTGRTKTFSELMSLNYNFSYLGQQFHRNIYCDVYEAIQENDPLFAKKVMTYFVMTPDYQSAVDPDTSAGLKRSAVKFKISVYENQTDENPTRQEVDFFDFRHLQVDDQLANVEGCFREASQNNYFAIHFNGQLEKVMNMVKAKKTDFESKAKELILGVAKISRLQLPYLKTFTDSSTITLLGRMLNRPPVLAGFLEFPTAEGFNDTDEWSNLESPEHCARKCLKMNGLSPCRGFNYCPNGCFYVNVDEVTEGQVTKCRNFDRAVIDSNLNEAFLENALDNLNKTVFQRNFIIKMKDGDDKEYGLIATRMEQDLKPFDFGGGDTEQYEELFMDHQLSINHHSSWEIGEGLSSVDRCRKECDSTSYFNCAAFSFCPTTGRCRGTSTYLKQNDRDTVDEIESATGCKVYRMKALEFFKEFEGKVPYSHGDDQTWASSVEACAMSCRNNNRFVCQGFELCDNTCIMYKDHILDLSKPPDVEQQSCSFYFLDYGARFVSGSNVIVVDKRATRLLGMTFNECAKMCITEPELQCRSINFCPARPDGDSECQLNTLDLRSPGDNTEVSESCQHYVMLGGTDASTPSPLTTPFRTMSPTENTGNSTPDIRPTTIDLLRSGVTRSTFTGAVVGMLFFGIVVGAMAFLGYSYYRSRRNDSGISVRFTKETL